MKILLLIIYVCYYLWLNDIVSIKLIFYLSQYV
jgi:hypothetical protein